MLNIQTFMKWKNIKQKKNIIGKKNLDKKTQIKQTGYKICKCSLLL